MQNLIYHKYKAIFRTWLKKTGCIQSLIFVFLFGVLCNPSPAWTQPTEYLLKAGFLEKFARFTDWPEQSFSENETDPFVISVIGDSPFEGSLEKIYGNAQIKGRPVKIRYIKTADQIPGSHLLFICKSEKYNLGNILKYSKDYPILLVSDTKGFAEKGAHINLYITTKGTLHFEINPLALRKSRITIQVVLLEIAKIVGG